MAIKSPLYAHLKRLEYTLCFWVSLSLPLSGVEHKHVLHFASMPQCTSTGTLADCVTLGKAFVEKVIDGLNARFTDLPLLNATKLFSPKSYDANEDANEELRDIQHRMFLGRLCEKFASREHELCE